MDRFEVNLHVIPLYLDTTKTYLNLATGALGLTIAFRDRVTGAQPGTKVDRFMIASWIAFLLSIGCSSLYLYFAVKFLYLLSGTATYRGPFSVLSHNPGWLYGAMLLWFYVGAFFLVIAALRGLPKRIK